MPSDDQANSLIPQTRSPRAWKYIVLSYVIGNARSNAPAETRILHGSRPIIHLLPAKPRMPLRRAADVWLVKCRLVPGSQPVLYTWNCVQSEYSFITMPTGTEGSFFAAWCRCLVARWVPWYRIYVSCDVVHCKLLHQCVSRGPNPPFHSVCWMLNDKS